MCSTPKMPNVNKDTPEIATPTLADAEVTKASQKTRANTKGLAGRDIKTSARGLADSADTNKKKLLGE